MFMPASGQPCRQPAAMAPTSSCGMGLRAHTSHRRATSLHRTARFPCKITLFRENIIASAHYLGHRSKPGPNHPDMVVALQTVCSLVNATFSKHFCPADGSRADCRCNGITTTRERHRQGCAPPPTQATDSRNRPKQAWHNAPTPIGSCILATHTAKTTRRAFCYNHTRLWPLQPRCQPDSASGRSPG